MKKSKKILKSIAKNFGLDPVLVLVTLWDYDKKHNKFEYLKSENSVVRNKDARVIKKILESNLGKKDVAKSLSEIKPIKIINKDYDFNIGNQISPIKYIIKDDVLKIYEQLVNDFESSENPISPSGIKDEGMLDSALFHPQTSFGNTFKYPTIESAGAALMYSLSNNHAFFNGNKRTSMVAMLVFLDRHNFSLKCGEDDLFRISLKIADHKLVEEKYLTTDAEIYSVTRWIHGNIKPMKKGERAISMKRLKQILTHFDCAIYENKVERIVSSPFFWNTKKLSSRIPHTVPDGQEASMQLIKQIREDLQLTPEYDIDSDIFYRAVESSISEFIIKYKNLLRRLSKV